MRCHEVLSTILEPKHVLIIRARLALGETFRAVGYFQEAIDELNSVLMSLAPPMNSSNGSPGMNSNDMGHPQSSVASGEIKEHSMHVNIIYARAKMIRDVGNYEEATKFFSYVLEAFTKAYGNKSSYVALVLGDMGDCLRLEKSEEVMREKTGYMTYPRIYLNISNVSSYILTFTILSFEVIFTPYYDPCYNVYPPSTIYPSNIYPILFTPVIFTTPTITNTAICTHRRMHISVKQGNVVKHP